MTLPIRRKSNKNISFENVAFFSKDATVVLKLLERTARQLGLIVRYEPLQHKGDPWECDGGLCRVLEEKLILINSLAPADQQCFVILTALRQLRDHSQIPPVVRRMMDRRSPYLT